jgi:hypothetical protein
VTPGDEQNRRREPEAECVCQGLGRIGDSPCMRGCRASLPYYAKTPPSPEAEATARRLNAMWKLEAASF